MILAAGGTDGHSLSTLLIELGAILFALGLLARFARALKIPIIPLYLVAGLFFGQGGFLPWTRPRTSCRSRPRSG